MLKPLMSRYTDSVLVSTDRHRLGQRLGLYARRARRLRRSGRRPRTLVAGQPDALYRGLGQSNRRHVRLSAVFACSIW